MNSKAATRCLHAGSFARKQRRIKVLLSWICCFTHVYRLYRLFFFLFLCFVCHQKLDLLSIWSSVHSQRCWNLNFSDCFGFAEQVFRKWWDERPRSLVWRLLQVARGTTDVLSWPVLGICKMGVCGGGGIKMLLLQPFHVMHRYLLFFLLFFLFLILFLESGHAKLTTHHPSAFLAALQCKGYLAAEPLACAHQTQAILIRLFAFNITLPGSISKPCCPPMAIKGDTGDEPM